MTNENDSYIRAFLAIEIPHDIQQKIKYLVDQFCQNNRAEIYWRPLEKLHITLKFFEKIKITNDLVDHIKEALQHIPSFLLKLDKIVSFPPHHGRFIVLQTMHEPSELKQIIEQINSLNLNADKKSFLCHVTLGKIISHPFLFQEDCTNQLNGFWVKHVILFRSRFKGKQTIYSPLERFLLKEYNKG